MQTDTIDLASRGSQEFARDVVVRFRLLAGRGMSMGGLRSVARNAMRQLLRQRRMSATEALKFGHARPVCRPSQLPSSYESVESESVSIPYVMPAGLNTSGHNGSAVLPLLDERSLVPPSERSGRPKVK